MHAILPSAQEVFLLGISKDKTHMQAYVAYGSFVSHNKIKGDM